MKVDVQTLDTIKKELTIEVDEERFNQALEEAFKEQKKKISIPGFRKGHAPRALIEQHYGKDFFYYDAAEKCVFPAYIEALKENEDIKAIAEPEFDIVQLELGQPFIFKAVVETKQDIHLGDYKNIEIEKIDVEVTDEDVMKEIKHVQETTALIEDIDDKDASVQNGDVVILDFCGKKDGVPFEGGTAEDYELTIGSHSFIEGFEEGMVGMKIGEEKDLELTFPEAYHAEDLAGADVVFTVNVKEIKRKVLAELDDDFAKDVSEFETLDAYKESVREEIYKEREEAAKMTYKNKVTEKAVELSDVVAPASMVKRESENYLNEMAYNMKNQGIELEQYLQLTGGNMDELRKECDKRAEQSVKATLVLEAIAEKEGLEVSEEEIEKEFDKLAEMYNMEKEDIKRVFLMQGQSDAINRNILMEKAVAFLLDEVKIG